MSSVHRQATRRTLEARFQRAFTYGVGELAAEHCQAEGLLGAAERCQTLPDLSRDLWDSFTFDWPKVASNPGGTGGRARALMLAKLELSVAWAVAGPDAAETRTAQANALRCLDVLWLEWAGYMVTTLKFEVAL